LIPENSPCRLYFDLEFLFQYNPLTLEECDERVRLFVDIIKKELHAVYPDVSLKHVIDLNSSTVQKFSRHLIMHLYKSDKEILFFNNRHAGEFVKGIKLTDPRFLFNTSTGTCSFVDTAVYTRNRNFRLYLSTKFKKHGCLLPIDKSKPSLSFFLSTLVCPRSFLDDTVEEYLESSIDERPVSRSSNRSSVCSEFGGSCFPKLDDFVRQIQWHDQNSLTIKDSKNIHDKFITYNVSNTRYCKSIGREHKSNGVYFCVNLTTKTVYQNCHDQNCKYGNYVCQIPDTLLV
jgi:hypothetical protein